ncbi:signal peptidase II [Paracoccus shanxieyensis]|uniref:Lipoprotein signal peptidase n=2 Tax=Paracoccus shanxieyensis TaxID=2675752 RepID=A0A6L6J3L0_9RHOB|nr:signal peptidase II [Paracoccus shanxieyensis]MTH65327.1 signal peptidase II [Paracoccus shanxieyensis]MTH88368.1 signal peptidase II [Paracoccus shanxieyensis]
MADTATPKARKAPAKRRVKAPPPPSVWKNVGGMAAAIFLLDQALKYVVVHVLDLDRVREIDVLDPWLNLRMAWNQGMNFGLFASDVDTTRWVLIAIAFAVCLWVAIWVGRAKPRRFAQLSAGMLIGGALGNVVDRFLYGAVADFLNMSLPGWQNPFSFNVADIAIFLGAIGLVLMPPEKKPEPKKRRAPAKPRASKPAATVAAATSGPDHDAEQAEFLLEDPAPSTRRDGNGKTS